MAAGGMADDGCPGVVEARVRRRFLENGAGCEADVLKGSRPTATGVADPPVFYVTRDYSLGGDCGAEMPDMRQVIFGLPETTMDNEEQRERSLTFGKSELYKLVGVVAVTQARVKSRWMSTEDAAQRSDKQDPTRSLRSIMCAVC